MVLADLNENRWVLGLERVRGALDLMGHPERSYTHVIVAGTNGKGSTCVYLEQILLESGRSVGTTLSPHLERFTERFRIDGREVGEAELEATRRRLEPLVGGLGLTYFEWCVILAVEIFRSRRVDVGIFEAGLGGRYDASNALDPAVCVITDISLDHTDILGPTIPAIAAEKACIARKGRPLITSATGPARSVIVDHAALTGADVILVDDPVEGCPLMEGSRQGINAALALEAATRLGVDIERQDLCRALARARLPGRIEWAGEKVVMDVAHNEASVIVLVRHLQSKGFDGVGVLGVLADKDFLSMARELFCVCRHLYIAPVRSQRSWGDQDMARVAGIGPATICGSVSSALEEALGRDLPVVVTGSFHTVAEVRERLACRGSSG